MFETPNIGKFYVTNALRFGNTLKFKVAFFMVDSIHEKYKWIKYDNTPA